MSVRSVTEDCRVGRPRPDSDLKHPTTKTTDRFRHRAITRIMDRELKNDFSWEATYNGQIFWIEDLYHNSLRNREQRLNYLLKISLRVFDKLIEKIERYNDYKNIPIRTDTSYPTPRRRQFMSLEQWASVHYLRNCEDPNKIANLPVPEKIKNNLVFDCKELLTLPQSLKPPSFIYHRNKTKWSYPELRSDVYYQ